jgi:hypothetical protein
MRLLAGERCPNAEAAGIAEMIRLCVLCGLCVLVVGTIACGGATSIFRQYEYEEEIYLSLDGSATVYVNSSLAALNALRGTSFDASPTARVDVPAIRAFFNSATTRVTRVSQSRRNGRRYVHVRLDADDVRGLEQVPPFAWSTYDFRRDGDLFIYHQTVGDSATSGEGGRGWNGREIVAFRLHLPSKIRYHNTRPEVRGNILVWEQPLADRLYSRPLALEARMDPQSILYRTLWLFGITFVAVGLGFVVVIWWVMRKGRTNMGDRESGNRVIG